MKEESRKEEEEGRRKKRKKKEGREGRSVRRGSSLCLWFVSVFVSVSMSVSLIHLCLKTF